MSDPSGWPEPPPTAVGAGAAGPSELTEANLLGRYRALQIISILLILGGLGGLTIGLVISGRTAASEIGPQMLERAVVILILLAVGGIAFVAGLVMNAVRALIVRGALPRSRYRGPPIFVLLLLAATVASLGVVSAIGDLLALQAGDEPSIGGSLLLLTINQIALLAVAGAFVVLPRALEGVRLLPQRGGGRSIMAGLGLAVPAWIGATILGYVLVRLLQLFGREPEAGMLDLAVASVDPTVLVLALVVVAPAAEELFFRGVVFNAWAREYGTRVALFGSAALFAVIHANPLNVDTLIASAVAVVPIFGLGIALALVYRATGGLVAPIAMHAGFNAISVTIALLIRAGILDIPIPT